MCKRFRPSSPRGCSSLLSWTWRWVHYFKVGSGQVFSESFSRDLGLLGHQIPGTPRPNSAASSTESNRSLSEPVSVPVALLNSATERTWDRSKICGLAKPKSPTQHAGARQSGTQLAWEEVRDTTALQCCSALLDEECWRRSRLEKPV